MTARAAVLAAFLSGCLPSEPVVPVNAGNQAQVQGCAETAVVHNDEVSAGIALAGASAAGSGVSAALQTASASTKVGLAVGTAIVAALAGVDTGLAALSASAFASAQCSGLVGTLPSAARPR